MFMHLCCVLNLEGNSEKPKFLLLDLKLSQSLIVSVRFMMSCMNVLGCSTPFKEPSWVLICVLDA